VLFGAVQVPAMSLPARSGRVMSSTVRSARDRSKPAKSTPPAIDMSLDGRLSQITVVGCEVLGGRLREIRIGGRIADVELEVVGLSQPAVARTTTTGTRHSETRARMGPPPHPSMPIRS
jgi:hypothetical protein